MNIITSPKTKIVLSILGKVLFFVGIVAWILLKILAALLILILIAILDDDGENNPGLGSIYNFRTGELDSHRKYDGIYDDDMFW